MEGKVIYTPTETQEDVLFTEPVVEEEEDSAKLADTERAITEQYRMSLKEALHKYKKAMFWSVAVSLCIVMESYDTILINSFYAYPTFQRKFGDKIGPNRYSVPAAWQTALSLVTNVGIILGIFANGFLIDRFGHRMVLLVSLIFLTGFIGVSFGATTRGMLLTGQLLCGLPWGTINTIAVSYAVETAPLTLRHWTPTFVNLCWYTGHMMGSGILEGLESNKTEWGWRIPLALQWMFPVPLFVALLLAPDSPWWLVRKGKQEAAVRSFGRLSTNVDTQQAVKIITRTVKLEGKLGVGATYLDCFRGTDRRRTEIAAMVWMSKTLTGFGMSAYNTYFFEQAGLPASDAFKLSIGVYALCFIGNPISVPLQAYLGRRILFMAGLFWMFCCMILIGILASLEQTSGIKWAQAILLLLWFFAYGSSIGPLAYTISSEIGSARLRQKTISLSCIAYYTLVIINAVAAPYMLNPEKGDFKGKAAFIPAGLIVAVFVWASLRLPETKGRSFEDLDIMFHRKISARNFSAYVLHPVEDKFSEEERGKN